MRNTDLTYCLARQMLRPGVVQTESENLIINNNIQLEKEGTIRRKTES